MMREKPAMMRENADDDARRSAMLMGDGQGCSRRSAGGLFMPGQQPEPGTYGTASSAATITVKSELILGLAAALFDSAGAYGHLGRSPGYPPPLGRSSTFGGATFPN